MSLKPTSVPPLPELTTQVALAEGSKGNVYMQIRDDWAPSSPCDTSYPPRNVAVKSIEELGRYAPRKGIRAKVQTETNCP